MIDKRMLARAVMRRVAAQFPLLPEAKLMCAIIGGAVTDLFDKSHRRAAEDYLNGEMKHAEMCGVDSVWIRESLQKAGVLKKKGDHHARAISI